MQNPLDCYYFKSEFSVYNTLFQGEEGETVALPLTKTGSQFRLPNISVDRDKTQTFYQGWNITV